MTAIQQTTDALPDQTDSTAGKAMAVPVRDEQDVSDAEAEDAAFLRESYLAFAVPLATDRRLEQALEQCHGSPQDLIEATEERESLFFDETVDVYFILRTRHEGAAHLQSFLDRLSITLDAHIVNIIPGRETPPPVEVIFNGSVEEVHRPLLVVSDPEPESEGDEVEEEEADGENEGEDEDGKDGENDKDEANDEEKEGNSGTKRRRRKAKQSKQRAERQTFVIWRLSVFLTRPRARLHAPSVSFAVAASLRPAVAGLAPRAEGTGDEEQKLAAGIISSSNNGSGGGFLQSRQPCGLNLLAALAGDPMLQLDREGGWPRLSAQRVSRVAPAGLAQQQKANQRKWAGQPQPLRGQGATVLPIVPAVHARIRFVRPSTVPTSAAVVGVLELDFTPFFDCEAVLTRVEVTVRGGEVVDLNGEDDGNGDGKADEAGNADKAGQDGMRLPLFCVARDHLTFLYRLSPAAYGFDAALNTIPTLTPPTSRELDIAVEARVLVRPGMCEPSLAMAWTTAVDFSLPVNPGFGTALPPVSLQRGAHRPSQLSIDGMASMMAPAISRPDALPSLEAAARSTETTIPDFGITMTLTAPDRPVYAGEEFCWTVFIVNRTGGSALPALPGRETNGLSHGYGHGSANVHSASGSASTNTPVPATPPRLRKLALLVLPRRRRNDVRVMRPPSTSVSGGTVAGGRPRAATNRSMRSVHSVRLGGGGDEVGERAAYAAYVAATTSTTSTMSPEKVADAVLDENVVHAMQRSSLVDGTDVVCLSADTRVGPLAPHACHVVELRFVALRAGAVGIEAVRVVDLGSQEHVDVRELPAMMVLEREEGDKKTTEG